MTENIQIISNRLNTTDYIIFFLVLAITIGAVVWSHLRAKSQGSDTQDVVDYILLGRKLTLPLFTATLVATWYGGIFGVTELSFKYGIYNFVTQGVFWYVTYLIFALYLVKKVRGVGAITLPELVAKNYGPKASKIAAVFNFSNVLPVAYTISLGIFMKILFGIPLIIGIIVGTAFVVAYSSIGGFRSVLFSDVIQFFTMCTAVAMVFVISLTTFGGLSYLKLSLPESHFSITGGNSISTLVVWGLIALSTLVDPNFYQRCFAASSDKVAKLGIIISTFIWFIFDICTTAGGMYARARFPDANPTEAYLIYSLDILPPGARGFFLAGILATILSTIDSYLFVAGNTVGYDLLSKKFRGKVIIEKISIIAVGFICIALSLVFDGSVKQVWLIIGSYSAGCLLFPIVASYIKPGYFSEQCFIWGTLAGAFMITVCLTAPIPEPIKSIESLYVGLLTTSGVMFFVRRLSKLNIKKFK